MIIRLTAVLVALSACTPVAEAPLTTPPVSDASVADADAGVTAAATPVDAAPVVTTCMSDERLYGTTCCRTEMHGPAGYTTCRGPNIGVACTRQSDCDVRCGCDDPKQRPPMQGSSPRGPADGTRGVTGTCMGQIVDGAWYCVIDENGVVTHFIRN